MAWCQDVPRCVPRCVHFVCQGMGAVDRGATLRSLPADKTLKKSHSETCSNGWDVDDQRQQKCHLNSTKLWGIYEEYIYIYIHMIWCGYTIINHPLNHHKWLVWTIKIWVVYGIVLPTLFFILGIPSAIPPVVHSWVVAPKDREIPLE